jgi:hypothetical protein
MHGLSRVNCGDRFEPPVPADLPADSRGLLRQLWCFWAHTRDRREVWESPGQGEPPALVGWFCARCRAGDARLAPRVPRSGRPRPLSDLC